MSHVIRLGDTPWHIWRLSALRGAGFPTERVRALFDDELAAAMDSDGGHDTAYVEAYARLTTRLARVAQDSAFREAVCWQSPHLLATCVDKVATTPAPDGRLPRSKERQRLLTVAGYLQRYCLKNDSIGFFGPVGWARWTSSGTAMTVRPGEKLVACRTVYFENWAIDAVARAFVRDPELTPWLRPRFAPQNILVADGVLTPLGRTVPLTAGELAVLRACDGASTAEAIVGADLDMLMSLRDRGLVRLGLDIPFSAHPEVHLREQLRLVPDPLVRKRHLAALDELTTARDAVAAAAGDADGLATALSELDDVFRRITGEQAVRRAGQSHAGRTLVYEDAVRDLSLELGRPLADALAGPLDLLLRAARWLASTAAHLYRSRLSEIFDRLCRRTGRDWVPFALLYGSATPDLAFSYTSVPPFFDGLLADFHRRWSAILAVPPGTRDHRLSATAIADAVAREFACAGPRWSSAIHHAPDIMLAAAGPGEINDGDFLAVLGELHVSANTLESRLFVEQADDPDWLRRADERDHAGRRTVVVPARESPQVNSRTYPSALLSPTYTYWTAHPAMTVWHDGILPAAALRVIRRDGELVVYSTVDGRELDPIELIGETLSGAVMNGFSLLPSAEHRPRITIDRLVVSRESWRFTAAELGWAGVGDGGDRFRAVWRWHREHSMPRQCFYRVPVEDKPVFVDFSSIALVEMLARAVRRSVREGDDATVSFSEMLPDLNQMWLTDAQGRPHTAELRIVALDPIRTPASP